MLNRAACRGEMRHLGKVFPPLFVRCERGELACVTRREMCSAALGGIRDVCIVARNLTIRSEKQRRVMSYKSVLLNL